METVEQLKTEIESLKKRLSIHYTPESPERLADLQYELEWAELLKG